VATALTVAVAALLYVAVVLPAERAVDPTGFGKLTGLLEMGEVKREIAEEAAEDAVNAVARAKADSARLADSLRVMQLAAGSPPRTDTVRVRLAAADSATVRLLMPADGWARYTWQTDGATLDDDVRGDSTGAPAWWYYRYGYGSGRAANSGVIAPAFAGSHGVTWYSGVSGPVRLTLITQGRYDGLEVRTPTATTRR
jgi:hypothetical protein